jgi:hypothetical protein
MSPIALWALQIAIADTPAILQAINLAMIPQITPEQVKALQDAMNNAVDKLDADVQKMPG